MTTMATTDHHQSSSEAARPDAERRLKVLLLATSCDADDVGESWWGHQVAERLSHRTDATILTLTKHHKPGSVVARIPSARVIEFRDWPIGRISERFNALCKPGYLKFYRSARRTIRELLRHETFDLIHHFTPLGMRYPSPAVGFGLPVIIGPVGGSVPNPPSFRGEMRGVAWYTKLRALDAWRVRHDPWLRRSFAGADLVIGVAPYVGRFLAPIGLKRFEVMNQSGILTLSPAGAARRTPARGELRLLYVGRVVRTKGLRDLIRAMARLGDLPGVTLDAVGDGEDAPACRREAGELGVAGRVRFHGRLPRREIDAFYSAADLFVFPSFREPSGQVVLEAMSFGLPLVVCTEGGPGFTVRDEFGIRVEPRSPEAYAAGIAEAVRSLADAPERLVPMGLAARREIADHYLWDKKVDHLLGLYRSVLESRPAPVRR